ncbi:hypothetical protein JAO76_00480 [Pontibacter sp. BT310]|uniref:Uncharacterized protein n=1 Tax=Pontibacter populi TaxID=890055 RepID=A0ABS6X793_9BACT|nr:MULTISPECIES: hypothetical protein [Pontibacter]MBJ6116650.1 hypothetical protein [Pontibacter sp. BT310]MBR0569074.1 hypothetical protein [Microvirga sp. STS03]MBW3363504.1 hypothetical protein [Pontibacter populi]
MNWFKSKKEKKQFSKMIAVYLSEEYRKILVAPFIVDESWLRYEQEDVEVLSFDVTDELLGESIKRNLEKFAEKNKDSTKRNLTDWPAFKASKLKTVKEFEKKYSRISISGLNEANISLAMDAETKSEHEINLRTTLSAYADNKLLGIRLRKIHKAQIEKKIE